MLPVFVEQVRHQAVERAPVDAARHHVVDQPRQIGGQRQRRGGTAHHQRRRHRGFRPRRDEMGERQPAFQLAELWWNIQRRAAAIFGLFRKGEFVLVDIAERHDARQDRRLGLQHIEKYLARQPSRAPGRQIERRLCQPFRICTRLESVHQPAIDQSGDDGAQ